jgi:hypothetical protein
MKGINYGRFISVYQSQENCLFYIHFYPITITSMSDVSIFLALNLKMAPISHSPKTMKIAIGITPTNNTLYIFYITDCYCY